MVYIYYVSYWHMVILELGTVGTQIQVLVFNYVSYYILARILELGTAGTEI